MAVMMNPSLCIGAQASVFLPSPRFNHRAANDISLLLGYKLFDCFFLQRQSHGSRYNYPTRVSMRFQNRIGYDHSLKAVGTGAGVRKGFGFASKNSKTSLFACNAALNAICSQGQTQTITRKSPTITKAPTHGKEKSTKLDDGGSGFPPRYGGGGGGGGGGGESFSGGFFLFGLLMFMAYIKDLEGEHDDRH